MPKIFYSPVRLLRHSWQLYKNKLIRVLPILTAVFALLAWLGGNLFENEANNLVSNLTEAKHIIRQITSEYLLTARISDLRRMHPDNDISQCDELLSTPPQINEKTKQEEILHQNTICAQNLKKAIEICGNVDRYLIIRLQTLDVYYSELVEILTNLLKNVDHKSEAITKTIQNSMITLDSYKKIRHRHRLFGTVNLQEETSYNYLNCMNINTFRGHREQLLKEWRETGAYELDLAFSYLPEALKDLTAIINQNVRSANNLAKYFHLFAFVIGLIAMVLMICEKWVE